MQGMPLIASIHVGKIAPLGPEGIPSGFIKRSVSGPVEVTPTGLAGDQQADLSVHGGPEKAVYGYGSTNYLDWRREYPQHSGCLVPGGLGENLAIDGLREADLCVGDIHRIGTAQMQVCQPRQPCFKLALRFDDPLMAKAMVRTGRSGWYYRVLEPGVIEAGNAIELLDRPNPNFPFSRLVELISRGRATRAEWELLQNMPGLASNWKRRAGERLMRSKGT